jgi:hypothetical protein
MHATWKRLSRGKAIFQLPGVNAAGEPILRKKLTRSRMAEFSNRSRRQSSESGRMADLIAGPNCPALSAAR